MKKTIIKVRKHDFEDTLYVKLSPVFAKINFPLQQDYFIFFDGGDENPIEICLPLRDLDINLSHELMKPFSIDIDLENEPEDLSQFLNTKQLLPFFSLVYKINVEEVLLHKDFVYLIGTEIELSYDERSEFAANNLLDFVNGMCNNDLLFAQTIAKSHRSLQDNIVSMFLKVFKELSKNDTDARNELAVKIAKDITNQYCICGSIGF